MLTVPTSAGPDDRLDQLVRSLDTLRVGNAAAMQVLMCVDDPNADAPRVAAAIEGDTALATQVLKLANSAFYGVSRGVGNVSFAVTVIGFSAVRSMAAVQASGLRGDDVTTPDGFWRRAALSAGASSAVAPIVKVPVGDAFAVGLLQNIGLGLLHNIDPNLHQELIDQHGVDGVALRDAEIAMFGIGHDHAGARALELWHFPKQFVEGISDHHLDGQPVTTIGQVLMAANAVAALVDDDITIIDEPLQVLERLSIPESQTPELMDKAAERAGEILASLS